MSKQKRREIEAYQYMKAKIDNREWLPQKQLKEQELTSELKMSRTPVRNAFLQLEKDGLIVIEPYKGAKVLSKEVDIKAFQDRIKFIELMIIHYFLKLEKEEKSIDTKAPAEKLQSMQRCSQSAQPEFEKLELEFWQYILTMEHNQYHYSLIMACFKELFPEEGSINKVLYRSRQTKIKQYQQLVAFLSEANYPYARREIRILLNQIRLNVIQGID